MTKPKPTVTIFTADTGHTSVAQAIEAVLKPHYLVHIANVSVPGFSLYYPFYRYFPQLSQIGYKASHRKRIYQTFQKFLGDSYRLKIIQTIAQDRSDILISTYYPANPTLESFIDQHPLPFINILTDPRTISPFLPSPKALNLVFDRNAYNFCLQTLHLPAAKLKVSGWLTRPEFQPGNQSLLKKQLKIPPTNPTFLLAAGSEGTNLVLKIIPTFLQTDIPLTVYVACGHNQLLFDTVKNIDKANHLIKKNHPVKIIPLSFTPKLFQYLQVSDLVIGKAGPNLLFEAVACHVPFFAITHISGQEDGNLDLIRDYQLGFVEENPIKANRLLKKLIHTPQTLTAFQPHLKKLAAFNRQAPQILLNSLTLTTNTSAFSTKSNTSPTPLSP